RHYHIQDLHSFPTRRSSDLTSSSSTKYGAPGTIYLNSASDPAILIIKGRGDDSRQMVVDEIVIDGLPVRDDNEELHLSGAMLSLDRKSTRLNSSHVKISYAV